VNARWSNAVGVASCCHQRVPTTAHSVDYLHCSQECSDSIRRETAFPRPENLLSVMFNDENAAPTALAVCRNGMRRMWRLTRNDLCQATEEIIVDDTILEWSRSRAGDSSPTYFAKLSRTCKLLRAHLVTAASKSAISRE